MNLPDRCAIGADGLAFMFESRWVITPTRFETEAPLVQLDYESCWADFKKAEIPQ